MILSDTAILRSIKNGQIRIEPDLTREHLRPAGVRVHLGRKLLIPQSGQLVDLANPTELRYDQHDLDTETFVLEPSSFVLASTLERIQTASDLLCVLDGRSTIARLGLAIHNAASVLDGTHNGWMTPVLEIVNHGNMRVVLRTGTPIGMLCFHQMKAKTSKKSHHAQYADQSNTTAPVLHLGATLLRITESLESPESKVTVAQR
jgi:dCTP deaminase